MDERENWEFVAYSDKLEKYGCMDAAIRTAHTNLWIIVRCSPGLSSQSGYRLHELSIHPLKPLY